MNAQFPAQHRERSLRSLYCCSDGVRGRGAPVTYLSHMPSFHSNERIAPSNLGIKHLGDIWNNVYVQSTRPYPFKDVGSVLRRNRSAKDNGIKCCGLKTHQACPLGVD